VKGASAAHDEERPSQARHPCELEPGTRVHAWRIVRTLGEGGYGFVYLVELPGLEGEPFTLKLSKFRQGEGGARADKERALLSRVEHPNIVRVWGHGYWPHPARGWPYLVMEYVEGPGLWPWLEQHNPTPRDVTAMVTALADALATVHERGALHRDVKGDNVLVRASDGQPVLLDFGVGDYEDSAAVTQAVLPPGTTHYRSPESLRFLREHRDTKARYEFHPTDDLYALGVVCFRLLADEYPFSPSLPPDLLYADIEHRVPPGPGLLNPRVPAALSAIVSQLLAKRPEERIASARALHEQLVAVSREADASWDSALFEWQDERTPQSRPTEEAPRPQQGAPAPGALPTGRRVRQRVDETGTAPEATPTSRFPLRPGLARKAAPPTSLPSVVAAELRFHRRLLSAGALLVVMLLVLMVARVGLGETPEARTPPSVAAVLPPVADAGAATGLEASHAAAASPATPLPHTAPRPQGSASSMNLKKPQPPVPATSEKRLNTLMGQCLAVAATASMAAACSGAPVRPESREPCPREVVRAMERNGLRLNQFAHIWLDANDADALEEDEKKPPEDRRPFAKVYENGPITSRVWESAKSGAPKGTLLYGYIWVDADPEYALIRYTEAVFPNGRKFPVCMHATDSFAYGAGGGGFGKGVPKRLGSSKRAALLNPGFGAAIVDIYP
jgi:serine/threonine-protein kinase